MKKTSSYRRSPLHTSALTLKDIVPGRELIWVNPRSDSEVFVVVKGPYVTVSDLSRKLSSSDYKSHMFDVRKKNDPRRRILQCYLSDFGIVPYSFGERGEAHWSPTSYSIDPGKAHLPSNLDNLRERIWTNERSHERLEGYEIDLFVS